MQHSAKINERKHEPLCDTDYQTADLGCAAAIISAGFDLTNLDKENIRKVRFIFQRTNGIEEAVHNYWSDSLRINARTMVDNIKMLKNRIYSTD